MQRRRIAALGLAGALLLTVPAAGPAEARKRVLEQGMSGKRVKTLQVYLNRAGFRTGVDGAFGPLTRAALVRWERSRKRRADGRATPAELRALRRSARYGTRLLKPGMRGRDVKALQLALTRAGFGTAADGVFGPLTRSALMRWEGARGRRVDGIATRHDQRALARRGGGVRRRAGRGRVRAWISRRGFAHVSRNAPRRVRRLVRAGNRIAKHPYRYGGGHSRWRDSGYDCSGSVSYVLHHAGLLRGGPRASGGFTTWGRPGRGRHITVYAHGGHVFLTVAGLRFDTTDRERDGTRWHRDMRSTAGYAVRRP